MSGGWLLVKFSESLKQNRERIGLTQGELAKAIGISIATINRYENGKHEPTPIVRKAIIDFFREHSIEFVYDEQEDSAPWRRI